MYVMPQTLTVRRAFTADRVKYEPGQIIPAHIFAHVRSADQLLSRRFVVPTPDPHSRKNKPETPTPTAQPAKVRKQIVDRADDSTDGRSVAQEPPAPKPPRQPRQKPEKPETDNDIQKIRDNFKKKTDGGAG